MNPPKRAYNYRYELHVCTQSPNSSQVIGFDIYLSWRLAKTETEPAGSWTDEMVLRTESRFIFNNDDFAPVFDCRVVWRADQASKLKLRCGRRKFRSFLRGCGSGGNWHWEVYILPQKREAHLLNWLRRCAIDPTEWDSEFVDRIWKQRGAIRREHLRIFARDYIKHLKEHTS